MTELNAPQGEPPALISTDPESATTTPQTLEQIATRLGTLSATDFETALEVGRLVHEATQQLGHGELKPWITANCVFSYRTAIRRRNLHEFLSAEPGLLPELKDGGIEAALQRAERWVAARKSAAAAEMAKSGGSKTDKSTKGNSARQRGAEQRERMKKARERALRVCELLRELAHDGVPSLRHGLEQAEFDDLARLHPQLGPIFDAILQQLTACENDRLAA